MTRTISTKFIATALAVASLGFAGTAQAQAPAQGIAIGEPPPGQLPPGTQVNPEPEPDPNPVIVDPEPGTETGKATGEVDYTSPAYLGSKDSHDRFKRYCNMKDAEPSHSDKKFCEEYRKHHGTTGTAKPDPTGASKATGSTGASKATGSTGASKATGSNRASKATGSTRPGPGRRLQGHRLPAGRAPPAGRAALRARPTLDGPRPLAAGAAGSGPGRWRPRCPPAARQLNRHRHRSSEGRPRVGRPFTQSVQARLAAGQCPFTS